MIFAISGLWFSNESKVSYLQEIQVTFWCPMRFQWYPMDTQICKFRIGSYGYDMKYLYVRTEKLTYSKKVHKTVLDYSAEVFQLNEKDTFWLWESYINYSVTGFEIHLKRQSQKYIINYFVPSGLFVVVSWVI